MAEKRTWFRRRYVYYAIILLLIGAYYWYTWWSPRFTLSSEHYVAESRASKETTKKALEILELVHQAHLDFLDYPDKQHEDKLEIRVYENRDEFRRVNKLVAGWAEAFYLSGVCHQYIDETATNPHHWMVHEAVHQLNAERAGLDLPKWADEGLACLFSTCPVRDGGLSLGALDFTTYPLWWFPSLDVTGDLKSDYNSSKVMRLRHIIQDKETLEMDVHFNLYYAHWLSIVHYLSFGEGQDRTKFIKYLKSNCPADQFESTFGSYEEVEEGWYQHLIWMTRQ